LRALRAHAAIIANATYRRAMDPRGKVAVVTGAAGGIGSALVRALVGAGAAKVIATDLDAPRHKGDAIVNAALDVTDAEATERLVAEVEQRDGPIAIWFANAGVAQGGSYDAPDAFWDLQWQVNVMAHVYASRALVPRWIERGEGHLVTTASMAGILTTLGDGVYATTKHAAVGFAEWMAITYSVRGVKVSCICPGAVDTPMLRGTLGDPDKADTMIGGGGAISADDAAARVLEGVVADRFLILTHPAMHEYMTRKADDPDRWIRGMSRLWTRNTELLGD
jgi:NAD(P)-dependent dehydrogenase (short-subunit alcohol dehydrogenase family)